MKGHNKYIRNFIYNMAKQSGEKLALAEMPLTSCPGSN